MMMMRHDRSTMVAVAVPEEAADVKVPATTTTTTRRRRVKMASIGVEAMRRMNTSDPPTGSHPATATPTTTTPTPVSTLRSAQNHRTQKNHGTHRNVARRLQQIKRRLFLEFTSASSSPSSILGSNGSGSEHTAATTAMSDSSSSSLTEDAAAAAAAAATKTKASAARKAEKREVTIRTAAAETAAIRVATAPRYRVLPHCPPPDSPMVPEEAAARACCEQFLRSFHDALSFSDEDEENDAPNQDEEGDWGSFVTFHWTRNPSV